MDVVKFPALRPVPVTLMDEITAKDNWGPWMPAYKRPLIRCVCHVLVTVRNDSEPDRLTDELLEWDGRCFLKGNLSIFTGIACWRQRIETQEKVCA